MLLTLLGKYIDNSEKREMRLSDKTRANAKKMAKYEGSQVKALLPKASPSPMDPAEESDRPIVVLGKIYQMLKLIDEDNKLDREMVNLHFEDEEHKKNQRNQEIIKALTGRKKKIKKVKKEQPRDEKGRFTKAETPAPPTSVTTPTPTPSATPSITQRVAEVAKSTVSKVKEVAPTVATVAKASAPAILGAASISILGETGAKTVDAAIKKGGQVVPNDPKPGVTSYGIFGMNSAAGTASQFAAMNPQFNLTAKPATKEFDEQWKSAFQKDPKAFFDAQLAWYDKAILSPLRNDLQKVLDSNLAQDERIVGYMADRRIQYGKTMEGAALKSASGARTADQFIDKMTEFDLENIGTAFSTYLKNHPNDKGGLEKRIKMRKEKSLALPITPTKDLSKSSTENADLKKQIDDANITNNKVNTVVQNNQTNQITSPQKSKDVNPLLDKGRR